MTKQTDLEDELDKIRTETTKNSTYIKIIWTIVTMAVAGAFAKVMSLIGQ
jgi:hypothetical protein